MAAELARDKIRDFVTENAGDADIAEDQDIFQTGLVNSLFAMQLVLFIEKDFQIKVEDDDLDISNFNSIGAMADFVARKTA